MFRRVHFERLDAARRLGRRGLLLILGGLGWVGAGVSLLSEPRDRFSSPGAGTDSILQILDTPIFAYLWIIAGVITLFTGMLRDRRVISNHDVIGFNAFLTPPLCWTLFFAWSFAANIATGGREGASTGLYSFIVWALISLFIMVVAGWPETYSSFSVPEDNHDEERD
jgi:hypothetical protein